MSQTSLFKRPVVIRRTAAAFPVRRIGNAYVGEDAGDVSARHRLEVSRLVEDLTASYQGGWYSTISLHGGGSPEAMKREIWRNYPAKQKAEHVANLLDRGVAGWREISTRQPGKCCASGCQPPTALEPLSPS